MLKGGRSRPIKQNGDSSVDGGDKIVIIGARIVSVELVSLNGHIVEVVRIVTAKVGGRARSFRIDAVDPVPAGVIDHRGAVVRERGARRFVLLVDDIGEAAVGLPVYALHAIEPWPGFP
jgi:hypothetical protein